MAWIYKHKNGELMLSKTKPSKVYIFRFRNDEIYEEPKLYYWFRDTDSIIERRITEEYFESPGYYELFDSGDDYLVKKIYIEDCVFEGDYSAGFPITFKSETMSALKTVVDLENLTIENGLIEI